MAGDFDKLFGDDWAPQDPEPLRGLGDEAESILPFPADGDYTSETENRTPRSLNEKEVRVMNVYSEQEDGIPKQHFVLLKDNRGRKIRIYVGQFEALAIHFAIDGEVPERPMTHDLITTIVERLGGSIDRVIIDDLWNATFYAKISIVKPDGTNVEIDARSSDAIAIAVRAKAPIYMAEAVIDTTTEAGGN